MRFSWILALVISSCIALATADGNLSTSNITSLSDCANSCLATFTQCSSNETLLCVCHNTRSTQKTQECLIQHCSLADGMQFEQSLESSCPSYKVVQSQHRFILIVTLSLSGTAVLLTLLRLSLQIYEIQKLFAEDGFLFLAAACQTVLATLISLAVYDGFGEHVLDSDPGLLRQGLIYMFSATPVYWLVLLATRLSVVLYLRRINPGRSYRICAIVMMVFIVTWGIAIILLSILRCRPISYNWDTVLEKNSTSSVTQGSCLNPEILKLTSNAISLFQDVLILLLAIPSLWMLNLSAGKKFGASLLLLVGVFVCVAAALRLRSLVTFSNDALDPTWANVPAIVWSAIEASSGIILICLPVLGGALVKMYCRYLDFPDGFFERRSSEASTARYHSGRRSREDRAKGWNTQSSDPFGDNNAMERKFSIRRVDPFADGVSISSRNSHHRLALTLDTTRPESALTHDSGSREHLNRTYNEHHTLPAPRSPFAAAARRKSRRIASPTQGIFRDIIWRETPALPPSRPLPPPPTVDDEQLHPKPLRLSRVSQFSGSSSVYSGNSETQSRIHETRKSYTSDASELMGFPYLKSVQTSTSQPDGNSRLSSTSQADNNVPELEERRMLPKPPAAVLRSLSQPSARPRALPPVPIRTLTTKPLHKQIIVEHRFENLLDMMEMEKENAGEFENRKLLPPREQVERRSRIGRDGNGMAIEFNGQMLSLI